MVKVLLSDIVKEYMDEQERLSPHRMPFFMRLAKRGLEELHWDISGDPHYAKIAVNKQNNTAPIPSNLIREIGVYHLEGEQLIVLSRNNNLLKPIDDCGQEIEPQVEGGVYSSGFLSTYISKSLQFTGGFYGAGGRSIYGEYTVDFHNGLIVLSSDFCKDYIYLKYLGSPIQEGGDFKVHPFLKEPIKAYIHWKSVDNKDSVGAGEKDYRFERYLAAKLWSANQINAISKDEQRDINLKNFTLAPKL